MELTEQQFSVLAFLMRSHGDSREACRRVLVLGQRPCDVARAMGISANLVSVALANYRRTAERVDKAFAREYSKIVTPALLALSGS